MCVVSMVHDHFQKEWLPPVDKFIPLINPAEKWPMPRIGPNPQHPEWTLERWNEYQALLKKAKAYDERTGQPDCPDPAKEQRFKEIEAFIIERFGLKPKRTRKPR